MSLEEARVELWRTERCSETDTSTQLQSSRAYFSFGKQFEPFKTYYKKVHIIHNQHLNESKHLERKTFPEALGSQIMN